MEDTELIDCLEQLTEVIKQCIEKLDKHLAEQKENK